MSSSRVKFLLGLVYLSLIALPINAIAQKPAWETIADGLQLGRFKAAEEAPAGDSAITILRVDPTMFEVQLLSISETGDKRGRTARRWCEKYDLVAAVNAGMYAEDHSTHIGYMKSGDHVNNAKVVRKDYRSAAAFHPLKPDLPPFRIFDLDEDDIDSVCARYGSVIQNIRLIKRPGENRWPEKPDRWSEAALGEDKDGFMLFIFCRLPYTMHDLNDILLALPIGLVCAQHLEGGPAAQLYLKYGGTEIDLRGSYETGFLESGGNLGTWLIPNTIGISEK